jgi:hypothetical protein
LVVIVLLSKDNLHNDGNKIRKEAGDVFHD